MAEVGGREGVNQCSYQNPRTSFQWSVVMVDVLDESAVVLRNKMFSSYVLSIFGPIEMS